MRISKKSRPYLAGRQLGESLCEVGNILYLMDNRVEFLVGLVERVDEELESVIHVEGDRTWVLKKT